MPTTMSSRERMLATIRHEKTDRIPISPYIAQGPIFEEPLFWHDQIERAKRMFELDLDPTIDIWFPDPQPSTEVKIKTWREKTGKEMRITKEYHTPSGVLRQVVVETEDWCDYLHAPWIPTTWGIEKNTSFCIDLFDDHNVSRRVEPWVKGRADLDKLRHIILPVGGYLLDEWRMDAARAMEFAQKLDLLTVARRTIVGDAFQWFCDIPWFMLQLHEDPQFVKDFLGIFQDWAKVLVELALDVGVDVVQYRGWYEIPTFWGTRFWKEHLSPCIEEQAKMVHDAGKIISYLLPEGQGVYCDLLKQSSVDILQAIDPRNLHFGNLRRLADELGKHKTFWGGVNAEVTLESNNYDRIEKEVKEAVDTLGANDGLVLSALIFSRAAARGVLQMAKACRKYEEQITTRMSPSSIAKSRNCQKAITA